MRVSPKTEKRAALKQIAEDVKQMRLLADQLGYGFLAFQLAMVVDEAEAVVRGLDDEDR